MNVVNDFCISLYGTQANFSAAEESEFELAQCRPARAACQSPPFPK
jgi:hypothetical protein